MGVFWVEGVGEGGRGGAERGRLAISVKEKKKTLKGSNEKYMKKLLPEKKNKIYKKTQRKDAEQKEKRE